MLEGSVRDKAGTVSRFEVGWEEAHSKAEPKPSSSHGAVSAGTGQGTSGNSFGSSCDETTWWSTTLSWTARPEVELLRAAAH